MTAAKGTPEWHLGEATAHAEAADLLAGKAQSNPDIAAAVTRRLLAAASHAQIGALKMALQTDAMLAEMRETLYELRTNTTK